MNIQILELIEGAKAAKGLTVIIDVFRAMTVEAYVIQNGAARVDDETLRSYYVDFLKDTMAISRKYQQALLEKK